MGLAAEIPLATPPTEEQCHDAALTCAVWAQRNTDDPVYVTRDLLEMLGLIEPPPTEDTDQ